VATGVTKAGYTNASLTGNVTHYYVVSSLNASGESTNSVEASAAPPVPALTWQGAVNTNWDINVTTNWVAKAARAADGKRASIDRGVAGISVRGVQRRGARSIFNQRRRPADAITAGGTDRVTSRRVAEGEAERRHVRRQVH